MKPITLAILTAAAGIASGIALSFFYLRPSPQPLETQTNAKATNNPAIDFVESGSLRDLQDRMEILKDAYGDLSGKLEKLEAWKSTHEEFSQPEDLFVWVDVEAENMSVVRTKFGAFPIAISSTKPFLDGYTVNFKIGNPYSAAMCNVQLMTTCAPVGTPYTLRTTNSLTRSLMSGTWTTVSINLSPATPDQLRHLFVGLKINAMMLTDTQ